jgi:hypothetical protein
MSSTSKKPRGKRAKRKRTAHKSGPIDFILPETADLDGYLSTLEADEKSLAEAREVAEAENREREPELECQTKLEAFETLLVNLSTRLQYQLPSDEQAKIDKQIEDVVKAFVALSKALNKSGHAERLTAVKKAWPANRQTFTSYATGDEQLDKAFRLALGIVEAGLAGNTYRAQQGLLRICDHRRTSLARDLLLWSYRGLVRQRQGAKTDLPRPPGTEGLSGGSKSNALPEQPTRAFCIQNGNRIRWARTVNAAPRHWLLLSVLLESNEFTATFEEVKEEVYRDTGGDKRTRNDVYALNAILKQVEFPWLFTTKGGCVRPDC